VPNALTACRVAAIPAMLACWHCGLPGLAAGLFGAAALTDALDGYLARRWNQMTSLGALMDPLADKLLTAAALLALVEHASVGGCGGYLVTWPAACIIGRELFVSGLREWVVTHGRGKGFAVAWHGKVKTALQMAALQAMLIGAAFGGGGGAAAVLDNSEKSSPEWAESVYWAGLGLLWVAAAFTLGSGFGYARAVFVP